MIKQSILSTWCHLKCTRRLFPKAESLCHQLFGIILACLPHAQSDAVLEDNQKYLQQGATNTYKRVSYRKRYRQRTRKDHYRKLSRKIKLWMLIISFSVSIGFSGCGGSQVAFLLCLWFPSETIIALGKCIHVKNNFFHVWAYNKCQIFFSAVAASTEDPPLLKLKLHILGSSIMLFQGTPKISLDTQ